jgi:hypothetical protein
VNLTREHSLKEIVPDGTGAFGVAVATALLSERAPWADRGERGHGSQWVRQERHRKGA